MDRLFKIGVLTGILAVAIAVFENSQNNRYQFSGSGIEGVITDTRTGEFWTADGSHYEPRVGRITTHHPSVEDETAVDDRSNALQNCLAGHTDPKKCLDEFTKTRTAAPEPTATPPTPSQ